jgi:signal transduction histidine kinase
LGPTISFSRARCPNIVQSNLQRVRTGRAERITGAQPSEVAPLVAELNTLLDQNALNPERARRHFANLAHGLKTPLATLTVIMDERGSYADARLRPLVMTMDRRMRPVTGARGRAWLPRARPEASRVQSRRPLGAFAKLYADKGLSYEMRIASDIVGRPGNRKASPNEKRGRSRERKQHDPRGGICIRME